MKVSISYKYKEKDKVIVSVTSRDLWRGDVTLARVIYPFLKKYRKCYDLHKEGIGYLPVIKIRRLSADTKKGCEC